MLSNKQGLKMAARKFLKRKQFVEFVWMHFVKEVRLLKWNAVAKANLHLHMKNVQ
jgi:hypothetical protein